MTTKPDTIAFTFEIDKAMNEGFDYVLLYFDKQIYENKYTYFTINVKHDIIPDAVLLLRRPREDEFSLYLTERFYKKDNIKVDHIDWENNIYRLSSFTGTSIDLETVCKRFMKYAEDSYVCIDSKRIFPFK